MIEHCTPAKEKLHLAGGGMGLKGWPPVGRGVRGLTGKPWSVPYCSIVRNLNWPGKFWWMKRMFMGLSATD